MGKNTFNKGTSYNNLLKHPQWLHAFICVLLQGSLLLSWSVAVCVYSISVVMLLWHVCSCKTTND